MDGRMALSAIGGVDNRSYLTKLAEGTVRVADNVDVDARGVVYRRDGYAQTTALAGAHSLWSHPSLAFALVADAGNLYRMDTNGNLTRVVTGLGGQAVSYALVGQQVRWSNGVFTGQVDLAGNPLPLGVETPRPSFTLTSMSNGGISAGNYAVTLTFTSASGEEGGAPPAQYVDVADGGGILVGAVPPSFDAVQARVYVSDANGTELFWAGSCAPGGSFMVGAGLRTKLLATQFCEPFPAAKYLLATFGRLFGAVGRQLVWSQPMYYGLWRPTQNRLAVPDDITMVASPVNQFMTLYVGTRHKVYRLSTRRRMAEAESMETLTLSIAADAGVVPGSMAMIPPEALRLEGVLAPVPVWVGTDGLPYAGTDAGVQPLSQRFAYPLYDQAAAAFVQSGALSRYIVSGRGGKTSALVMQDQVIATVIPAGP